MQKSTVQPTPSSQKEKLSELGSYLQKLRIQQAISLEVVARKTQIPTRLLRAIEAGDLSVLPEAVYIRALLRQFAQVVGDDGIALSQAFPLESPTPARSRQWSGFRLPRLQLRPLHLYLIYIGVVIGAVNALSLMLKQSVSSTESAPDAVAIYTTDPAAHSQMAQPIVQQQSHEPVVVEVALQDQAWLQVVVDSEIQFEGTLPAGTQRTWSANEKLTLRTGNAGGVAVTLNDRQTQRLGVPGEAQTVTYVARRGG